MSEVDDFLAHHGVKGMRWGKRKPPTAGESNGSSGAKAPRAPMSRNKKIAIGVGIGAVAAIGAAVALKSMNKNMDLPMSQIVASAKAAKGKAAAAAVLVPKPSAPKPPAPKAPARDNGLTLRPAGSSPKPRTSSGLNLGAPARGTSPSFGGSTSPSLGDLNSIINGGPKITYDPKTGQYVTK